MEFQVQYCFKNMKGLSNDCETSELHKSDSRYSRFIDDFVSGHTKYVSWLQVDFFLTYGVSSFLFLENMVKIRQFQFLQSFQQIKVWKIIFGILELAIGSSKQDRCSNSLCSVTLTRKASSKIISFMFLKWQWITSLACA